MEQPVVVITGASAGLGAALARGFAGRSSGLVLTARTTAPLEALATELRAQVQTLAIAGSIDDDEHVHDVVAQAYRHFGRVDIVINNASTLGAAPMPLLEKLSPMAFSKLMNVNVRGPLHLVQHLLPAMRERGRGTIVNISSDAAIQNYAGWGGYGASKAALEHMSRTLAEELSGSGISVLVVDPGNMNTKMHRDAEPGVDLSDLPQAARIAPGIVEIIESARAPFARYEAQSLAGIV